MLFSQLGYYSLIFALIFSVILIPTVHRDLKIVNNVINPNILTVVFLQLFLVLLSFISFCKDLGQLEDFFQG